MAVSKKANVQKNKDITCSCCGKTKKDSEFYISNAFIYKAIGRLTVCKDCMQDIYNDYYIKFSDEKMALYYMCRALCICFNISSFNAAVAQKESSDRTTPLWRVYMTKLNSLGGNNGAGDDFDSSDNPVSEKKLTDEDEVEEYRDLSEFWGKGYEQLEYEFLENEYKKLKDGYDIDSQAQIILFQEICFQRLDIKKKRENKGSVDKELKTLQDLLGSANIKPAQENASLAGEQVTFGTLIKKYENEKPVPEPLPEWMTADWIKKYVVVWFFGNLSRMMGKENPFKDECEEEMDKYTVKLDDEDTGDE